MLGAVVAVAGHGGAVVAVAGHGGAVVAVAGYRARHGITRVYHPVRLAGLCAVLRPSPKQCTRVIVHCTDPATGGWTQGLQEQ